MFRQLIKIYSQNNRKADPEQMDNVSLIRVQQQVEEIKDFEYNDQSHIHAILHWNGWYKVELKRFNDQYRRGFDLSMQG